MTPRLESTLFTSIDSTFINKQKKNVSSPPGIKNPELAGEEHRHREIANLNLSIS